MFTFLLILQTLIAASLVAVILMQRSEGGGLGVGGSSSGRMTARGAADFLTRVTAVLGGLFIILSILLAALPVQPRIDRSTPSTRRSPSQQAPAAAATAPAGNESAPAVPVARQPAPATRRIAARQ